MPRKPSWTTEEDAIVLRMYPTAVAKLLTHRTRGSIAQHRFLLQHPRRKGLGRTGPLRKTPSCVDYGPQPRTYGSCSRFFLTATQFSSEASVKAH